MAGRYCFPGDCQDSIANWQDSEGDTCADYALYQWCTPDGGYGLGWNVTDGLNFSDYAQDGGTAADYCCAGGGGSGLVSPGVVHSVHFSLFISP